MNPALIHDKLFIKTFWEQKILTHERKTVTEKERMKNSALSKLRDEWLVRIENRTKHLKPFNDTHAARSEAKQALR
ncbi:protein FAM240C [Trichomycterus rosablanca]|uniref:protein FAM240C n=1 Tax=Trichomycterus rosablanca TaxID=2290929 RepID=UPI002F3512C5